MSEESKRWEYFVGTFGSFFGAKDQEVEDALNDLGAEGWEALTLYPPANSGKVTIVAKRPLTDRVRRARSRPNY